MKLLIDNEARAAIRAVAEWLRENECGYNAVRRLEQEARRRPKPPSLAEEALALINHDSANQPFLSDKGIDTIRFALERLQQLEKQQ